ncbi:neurobeachin-like protein 1, partial [Plakobranchus ocellatus]
GQVEVLEVLTSFLQVLTSNIEDKKDVSVIVSMIDAIVDMTSCSNQLDLQILLSIPDTFRSLMSALKAFSDQSQGDFGTVQWDPVPNQQFEALAKSVIKCFQALMKGSGRSKTVFDVIVGYEELSATLQSCGQTNKDMLTVMLDLAVEGCYADMRDPVLKNAQVAVVLVKWLNWIGKQELQIWLSERLLRLCSCSYTNRRACCKVDMVMELLGLLTNHKNLPLKTISDVICLVERLGSLSISAAELKRLIWLFKPPEDGEQEFPYISRLIRALSTMARRVGSGGPLHFFDIQHISNALSIPGPTKWPGHSFSFFCWLRLDPLPNLDSYEEKVSHLLHRRVLYSFCTSGGHGFEAFVCPDLRLTVATFSKKEFHSVLVEEVSLDDGQWHSVCVVHTPGRRFSSSMGQVAVYIDGKTRLNTPLKFPGLTEPFTSCYIGSPGGKNNNEPVNEAPVSKTPEVKKVSPLKSFFGFASRHHTTSNATVETSTQSTSAAASPQEDSQGPSICLHGQIESVCVFHDAVLQEQAKVLSLIGPNSLLHFSDDASIADLSTKLSARYSAKACKGSVCADLSSYNHSAIFIGDIITTHDVKEVINCLGGLQVLFPLLEHMEEPSANTSLPEESPTTPSKRESQDLDLDTWTLVDVAPPASEQNLEHNPLAAFITMLRYMLKGMPVNKDLFVQTHSASTLGMLIQKVSPQLIDVNMLMAVQYLVEDCDDHVPTKTTLLHHIYHYILFDFSLWSRTQFDVRIGHIQYLSTIIKDDRKFFRKKYGVQFFLDIVRQYYSTSSESCLSEEDNKTIRVSLLNLIKFYIASNIHADELNQIMGFILSVKDSTLVLEALDLLVSLLESRSRRHDQLILLLFEPDQADLLYQLLTYPAQPIIFYEKVVKILYLLLKTERVYEKSKARLRLSEIGHWGLINLMSGYDISVPMIKRFIDQVSFTDTPQMFGAVLAILGLVHNCGLDIKSEASRQLLALLVSRSGAPRGFAKQLGWQETVTRLLTLERKRSFTLTRDDNTLATEAVDSSSDRESTPSDTSNRESTPERIWDYTDKRKSSTSTRPQHLPLTPISEQSQPSLLDGDRQVTLNSPDLDLLGDLVPTTPLYIKRQEFYDLETPDTEDAEESRSSSASLEDLLGKDYPNPRLEHDSGSSNNSKIGGGGDKNNSSGFLVSSSVSSLSLDSSLSESMSIPADSGFGLSDQASMRNSVSNTSIHGSISSATSTLKSSLVDFSSSTPSTSDGQRMSSSENLLEDRIEHRRTSSVLRSDGFKQVLLGVGMDLTNDALEQKEELCQNVLIILLTIMWKGLEGSSQDTWKERCQVFTWMDELGESHLLLHPLEEIKRRLLEMLVHNCTSDIQGGSGSGGGATVQATPTHSENALEIVRFIHSFLTGEDASAIRFSNRLLEDTMSLLDVLGVWDTTADVAWTEMVHKGISILLAFSRQTDLDLVSSATVKLHSLVQTKLISSSAEASYILGVLNQMIMQALEEGSDNYCYLMPVLRALIDKGEELLTISTQLPHLPKTSMSPTFFDDFKIYAYSEEWQQFLSNYIGPQMQHFEESNLQKGDGSLTQFWTQCHEDMMMSHHRHNREIGESRLKFKNLISETYRKKVDAENRRFQNALAQIKNQHLFALKNWRAIKRFFVGERGAWKRKHQDPIHWKLSNQENFARMKLKLMQNYNFDNHINASRLRDNMGAIDTDLPIKLEEMETMKKALVSRENIADDSLGDEEWSAISASNILQEEYTGKEKLIISSDCHLITVMDEVKGRLEVTTTHVYFFDCNPRKEEDGEDFKWSLSRLREIHFRRYNLRRTALEVFFIDQTNYFINFPEKTLRNKVYSSILSLRPPNLIYKGQRSSGDLLRASGLTQKWVNREISNFEYLMQLNTIAGRSYNDLSQYHVFPWILVDYTSEHLDLENPAVFRDLSKPIGVVNPKNESEVREKFDTFEDPSGMIMKFHYGTHYSNGASVMHYLVRVEPFTTLHIQLQSGKFDVADRQFHTVPGSFMSLMDNPNDVKELIPEFFYFPEFLINFNGFDLGRLQITKEPVNDVKLPRWASTAEEFIHKHRQALESEHVSMNLHNWIDLIFGYKQKGPAAEEALNVFYYVTYEGAVDLDAIQDSKERASVEGMIRNFGQTPSQLLKEPHPKRLSLDEAVAKAAKSGKPMSVFHFLGELKPFFVEVSHDQDPLVFVNVPKNQSRSILQQGMPDNLISLTEAGIIGVHGWLPFDKSIPNFYTFDKDPTMLSNKTKKRLSSPFTPGLCVSSKHFAVSHDARLLFCGGFWDNSLQVYNLTKARLVSHVVRHIDVVTCLALDSCGRHLVTGSRDTTCMVWEIVQQAGLASNINRRPLQTLYGHDSEVTAVHISTEMDLVVSASKDGTVILHTVLKGLYTMTLQAPSHQGWTMDIPNMAVSDMGQIILYSVEIENCKDVDQRRRHEERHCLHLYSVNGKHLCSEPLVHSVGDMCVSGDHLVVGNTGGQLTISEIFGLRPLTTMELLVPIQCVTVANGNSHILVGLKDGKLIIVGKKGS